MKPTLQKILITGGVLTIGGPLLGVLGTVLGMMRSFNTLGKAGTADMQGLSSDISYVLISSASGLIIGVVGLIISLIGLIVWLTTKKESPPQTLNT